MMLSSDEETTTDKNKKNDDSEGEDIHVISLANQITVCINT